jgi:hypothetical protein
MKTKILFRKIIKAISFVIMLLQIISLSIDYFSYPINIKIEINYDKQQTLPSITLCTPRYVFISKPQLREHYPDIHSKILTLDPKYENCKLGNNKCGQNFHKYLRFGVITDLESIIREIRNKNKINTTLEQLFDRTLHLNEYIDCEVHFKNGRVINCSQINDLVEFFDGSNWLGKCFTYLNEKQQNEKNETQEFFITKNDFIAFNIKNDIITNIVGSNRGEEIIDLFLGIHSPTTFNPSGNYINFAISSHYNPLIIFSKTIYKTLEWPYNTDCDYYNQNTLYHSRDNCIEYCNLYLQKSVHGCITMTSNKTRFSVSNRRMNSKYRDIEICEDSNKYSDLHKCEKLCKRDCNEVYYEFYFNNENIREYSHQLYIRVNPENSPIIEYSAIPKYSFILYMTIIGGLMSLWLGISAIDLKAIFEISVNILYNITTKVISICSMNEFFHRFVPKFTFLLKLFKKIDLKKFTIILSFICFFYQLIELTLEFTSFKTTIYVDISPLLKLYKYNLTYFKIYDSITYCEDNFNYDSLELIESQENIINKNESTKSKLKIYGKMKNITHRKINISKYFSIAKSEIPSYMRCVKKGSDSVFTENYECIDSKNILISLSNLGKCYTYFSALSYSNENLMDAINRDLNIYKNLKFEKIWLERFYTQLIHDQYQLPSYTFSKFINGTNLFIYIYKFERLPPPYDSHCYDYKKSKSFKSRGHCINECIIDRILVKYNCLPKNSLDVLTLYENITINSSFCNIDIHENFNENECSDKCPKPCDEIFFISIALRPNLVAKYHEEYVAYVNHINMTFIYFITSIGGLLGLWNNISIYDLQLIFIKMCQKLFNLKAMKKLLSKSTKISKLLNFIRIFAIKINFKVKLFKEKCLHLNIKIYFSGIANYCYGYCSHDTNNFIH